MQEGVLVHVGVGSADALVSPARKWRRKPRPSPPSFLYPPVGYYKNRRTTTLQNMRRDVD